MIGVSKDNKLAKQKKDDAVTTPLHDQNLHKKLLIFPYTTVTVTIRYSHDTIRFSTRKKKQILERLLKRSLPTITIKKVKHLPTVLAKHFSSFGRKTEYKVVLSKTVAPFQNSITVSPHK